LKYSLASIVPFGKSGILLTWEGAVDLELTATILQFESAILKHIRTVSAVQAGMDSLAIFFKEDLSDYPSLKADVQRLYFEDSWRDSRIESGRLHEVPVCYDIDLVPELGETANLLNLEVSELISLHTGREYAVFMIGFLPGFPYIGKLSERLQLIRKSSPRKYTPRGAVAISGSFTGIYPTQSPGGWHIIGRTPLSLFDPDQDASPCFFKRLDTIRFVAIDKYTFNHLSPQASE